MPVSRSDKRSCWWMDTWLRDVTCRGQAHRRVRSIVPRGETMWIMSVTAVRIFSWREVKRSGEHHVTILENSQGGVELVFYAEPATKSREGGHVNRCHMQEKINKKQRFRDKIRTHNNQSSLFWWQTFAPPDRLEEGNRKKREMMKKSKRRRSRSWSSGKVTGQGHRRHVKWRGKGSR